MIFSSILFVFLFLPLVIFLYYISNEKYRNIILLAFSLIFYAAGEGWRLLILLASIICNYSFGCFIGRCKSERWRKSLLVLDIFLNIAILFYFKYLSYSLEVVGRFVGREISIEEIILPIGISFFTFQALSYVVDVYRRNVVPEKSIVNVGLYISFFPQLVAGPIVRYSSIAKQIISRHITLDKFGYGVKRFILGFLKKVILANNLALVVENAFGGSYYQNSVLMAWLGSISFSLQIFYDFSGYSDMAIGLGKMFGFDFEENFVYPYISKSVSEFWRRWHISLGRWFRDYVYIPLGGSYVGKGRHIINLLVVWGLTGIWHGARVSFVTWGLLFFVFLVLEKILIHPEKKGKIFQCMWRVVTLLVVNFGWILFHTESVHDTMVYSISMLGGYGNAIIDPRVYEMLREYGVFVLLGVVFATPIVPCITTLGRKNRTIDKCIDLFVPIVYMLLFIWAISFLVLGAHNPFIYYNF